MKLRYYLRGLGIGMVVTAIIMSVTVGNKNTLTNEEIKEKALALGMVDANKSLASTKATPIPSDENSEESQDSSGEDTSVELTAEPTTEPTAEPTTEPTAEPTTEPTAEPTTEPTAEPTTEPTAEPTIEPTKAPVVSAEPTGDIISLKVVGGDSSESVSIRMQDAGLVSNWVEFNQYLCANGYDKIISVGTYEIPKDSSFEDMAKIITRRK